jgi:hypothetical protein
MRIVVSALSAESPLAAILRKKEYNGVYGKIEFTENGANKSVGIMLVEQGRLVEKSVGCETQ